MRKLEYAIRKRNHCADCTECKSQYYCKHDRCIYPQEQKKRTGYPVEAMFARAVI